MYSEHALVAVVELGISDGGQDPAFGNRNVRFWVALSMGATLFLRRERWIEGRISFARE